MVADCQAAFDLLAADPMVDKDRIGVVGHCWGGRVAWLFACHNSRLAACTVFYGGRVMIPMGATNKAPLS
jgi:carboxymethylenebutenolidase